MAPGSGQPEHPHLGALSRDVERTGRRVDELNALVHKLAADITRHFAARTPDSGGGARPGVRAWLQAEDPEQAVADAAALIDWLNQVYLAYPGASLPTCWLWHPAMVEELWWLRCSHAEAYHPELGSWVRVGDWHDRLRPNVVRRIHKAAIACELSLHKAGGEKAHSAHRVPLTSAGPAMAAWVAAGRPDPAPEPSEAELEQSEQVHRESLKRSRR